MRTRSSQFAAGIIGLALALAAAPPARTADHRDAPAIGLDAPADINDVYAFVNPNNRNVVLAMTVQPLTVPGLSPWFAPDVLYQFKVDNTNDFKEDLVIQATFGPAGPEQAFRVIGPARPPRGSIGASNTLIRGGGSIPVISGVVDRSTASGPSGYRAAAGVFDDPFYFDFVYVARLLGILPGGPLSRSPGLDFFAGTNVLILIVEVPPAVLKGSQGNNIRIWATTSRARTSSRKPGKPDRNVQPFVQIERMGLPAINTVLINPVNKNAFNAGIPATDIRFRPEAMEHLMAINGDEAHSRQLAETLLPDALPLDVTSLNGFDSLNGRRPQDDVINTVLNLASKGAVPSDAVDANDRELPTDFPFFALPHTPDVSIPPRG